jgi:hypothetical protein
MQTMKRPRKGQSVALLTIIQAYAPDVAAQRVALVLWADLRRAGLSDREVEAGLATALVCGLTTDVWPWTNASSMNGGAR